MRNKIWIIVLSSFFLINSFLLFSQENKIKYTKLCNNKYLIERADKQQIIMKLDATDGNWYTNTANINLMNDDVWMFLIFNETDENYKAKYIQNYENNDDYSKYDLQQILNAYLFYIFEKDNVPVIFNQSVTAKIDETKDIKSSGTEGKEEKDKHKESSIQIDLSIMIIVCLFILLIVFGILYFNLKRNAIPILTDTLPSGKQSTYPIIEKQIIDAITFMVTSKIAEYSNNLDKFKSDIFSQWENHLKKDKKKSPGFRRKPEGKFSRFISSFKHYISKKEIPNRDKVGQEPKLDKELQEKIDSLLSGFDFSSKLEGLKVEILTNWKEYFEKVVKENEENAGYCDLGKKVHRFCDEVINKDEIFKYKKEWYKELYEEWKRTYRNWKRSVEGFKKSKETYKKLLLEKESLKNLKTEKIEWEKAKNFLSDKMLTIVPEINKEAELLDKWLGVEKYIGEQNKSIELQEKQIEASGEELTNLNKAIVEKDAKIEDEKGKNKNLESEKVSLRKANEAFQKEKEKWEEIEKKLSMKMSFILQGKINPPLLPDKWSEIEKHIGGLNVQIRGLQNEKNIGEELKKSLSSKMVAILPAVNQKPELLDKLSGIQMHINGLNKQKQTLEGENSTLKGQLNQKDQEIENKDKNIQILEVYRDNMKGILAQSETTSAWFPFISEGQRTALNYSKDNIDFSGILSFLLYYSLFCLEKSMIKKDLVTRQAMAHNLLNISEKISIPQNFFGSGKLHGFINFNTQIANYVSTSEINFENLESAPVYDLNAEFFQKMLRRIRDFSRLDLGPFYYIGKDEKIYRAD